MIPGTQVTGAPKTDLDRKIEQHLLALKLTEPKQNGALYFNLARMADTRNDRPEAQGPAALRARTGGVQDEEGAAGGAVPVVEGRI